MPGLIKYIRTNIQSFDAVITSEVFSVNSLLCVLLCNDKTIIWHELAKHQSMMKKIPSKCWYNIIARFFMRKTAVVARSIEAKKFIEKYCPKTEETVIEHGVNLLKFRIVAEKEDIFVVCSQLIQRKRIEGILQKYKDYLENTGYTTELIIIGDGDKKTELEAQAKYLDVDSKVKFTGKLDHVDMIPILARAKAMLINTEKDNSMISIIESIACGTPVITTEVPLNASYIRTNNLGIVGNWDWKDLKQIVENQAYYASNCNAYRDSLSTKKKVRDFIDIINNNMQN